MQDLFGVGQRGTSCPLLGCSASPPLSHPSRPHSSARPLLLYFASQAAATNPGHAFNEAHKRKLDKSWEPCHRQGITFLPLAVESLGAWHPSAVAEVKRLGSALARHTGEEESSTICRLFQKLSVCLVRGSAALFNNRSPPDEAALGDEIVW